MFNGLMYIVVDVLILGMAIISKTKNVNKSRIGINMTILSFLFFLIGYSSEIVQRISWYYLYGNIIALPSLYEITKQKKYQNIVRFSFIALAILIYYYRFSNNLYTNYLFYWE